MEDFLVNGGQNDAAGEDFFVEDLLVDGQDGLFETETGDQHGGEAGDKTPFSLSVLQEPKTEQSGFSPAVDDFGSVPDDDVADLEWLSHFVEDSFSGHSMTCPTGKIPENIATNRVEPVPVRECVSTLVQTKARSKRARSGGRVWTLNGSSSTLSSSADSDTWLIYPGQTVESLIPALKKQKGSASTTAVHCGGVAAPRRCSHCGVQKTPQWRAGPLGAKTLCNACGVRFKSGRLYPEYRPACSPTFSSKLHSNNHRKVMEMRKTKGADVEVGPSPVQSF